MPPLPATMFGPAPIDPTGSTSMSAGSNPTPPDGRSPGWQVVSPPTYFGPPSGGLPRPPQYGTGAAVSYPLPHTHHAHTGWEHRYTSAPLQQGQSSWSSWPSVQDEHRDRGSHEE
ncbi:unnamed protein product [Miscanthus lutarioriparius]|uniref:Uncharacterized protein n=1 Tax=Miscanthus lutarioriparius TaxID=422564 RepID=A0A811MJE5_9POAL|nr:unnamed protein product [Miscanthus lutarioriparius]